MRERHTSISISTSTHIIRRNFLVAVHVVLILHFPRFLLRFLPDSGRWFLYPIVHRGIGPWLRLLEHRHFWVVICRTKEIISEHETLNDHKASIIYISKTMRPILIFKRSNTRLLTCVCFQFSIKILIINNKIIDER